MESSQPHNATRELIVTTARSLLQPRVRFKPYGRNPKYGLDCIGVVEWVGKQVGCVEADFKLPRYSFPPQQEIFELFDTYAVRRDDLAHGSIAVFHRAEIPQHTGVVVWVDEMWKYVGVDISQYRPWVTMTPIEMKYLWRVYDYRMSE